MFCVRKTKLDLNNWAKFEEEPDCQCAVKMDHKKVLLPKD